MVMTGYTLEGIHRCDTSVMTPLWVNPQAAAVTLLSEGKFGTCEQRSRVIAVSTGESGEAQAMQEATAGMIEG